jgi:formylglycine-generating enzyme required for sulfatase activity
MRWHRSRRSPGRKTPSTTGPATGLPGTAPLLREVGSFAGQGDDGEEQLYDLGGNVAEWVVAGNGSGKAWGGSADRPADPKAQYRAAPLAYTGFRIVRGETKSK